jgi:hypothetical protein
VPAQTAAEDRRGGECATDLGELTGARPRASRLACDDR